MPKIFSYSVIHYGADYLSYALRSVAPFVDKSYIFYTPHPSHGHSSHLQPIESRDEIMASIPADEWDKLVWIDTEKFRDEGPQRDYAVNTLTRNGADIILNLDYDEIHDPRVLDSMLKEVWDRNIARNWLVNMSHLWRSFNYVCYDDGWPVRLIDTRQRTGTAYISPAEFGRVFHFGYAIKTETLKYKLSIHGHKYEMRSNWLEEKWLQWPPPEDCHPTNGRKDNGEGWWTPVPFDKNQLPALMREHKWWDTSPIE